MILQGYVIAYEKTESTCFLC